MREAKQLTGGQWFLAGLLAVLLAVVFVAVMAFAIELGWNETGFHEFVGSEQIEYRQAVGAAWLGLLIGTILRVGGGPR